MATQAALRQRIRDTVYSAMPQERQWLDFTTSGLVDGAATTFTVADADTYTPGDIIEFYDHSEQVLVTAINSGTNTLTVKRGWAGTTAAAQASGSTIVKNPRFTLKQIDDAITEVLLSFEGMGIHVFGNGSVTKVAGQDTYDVVETDVMDPYGILAVYYEQTTTLDKIPLPFRQESGLPTSMVASQRSLQILFWWEVNNGEAASYTYAKRIDAVGDLLARQDELVVLGAANKLLSRTIIPRTNDPGRYTDRTVQPGQGVRDARYFQTEFYMAAHRESAQLATERDHTRNSIGTRRARNWRP